MKFEWVDEPLQPKSYYKQKIKDLRSWEPSCGEKACPVCAKVRSGTNQELVLLVQAAPE